MMKTVLTLTNDKTMAGLANEIKGFLREKDLTVQCFEMKDGNYLIQGRTNEIQLLKVMGGDRAITVKLTSIEDRKILVEIGEGKWLDKISGVLVGWYLAWPVMLLTAATTYRQLTLPKAIVRCAQKYLEAGENVELA